MTLIKSENFGNCNRCGAGTGCKGKNLVVAASCPGVAIYDKFKLIDLALAHPDPLNKTMSSLKRINFKVKDYI